MPRLTRRFKAQIRNSACRKTRVEVGTAELPRTAEPFEILEPNGTSDIVGTAELPRTAEPFEILEPNGTSDIVGTAELSRTAEPFEILEPNGTSDIVGTAELPRTAEPFKILEPNGTSDNVGTAELPRMTELKIKHRPSAEVHNTSGRRIIAFKSLVSGVVGISKHSSQCEVADVVLDMERRSGLQSELIFKCKCGWVATFSSNSECNSLRINDSFAWGCENAAVGFTAATTLLTTLDIPVPDYSAFQKCEDRCKAFMEDAFAKEMDRAIQEEKELAEKDDNFVTIEGKTYAAVSVCVDGGWSQRSYGHSYKANCGVAVIIGIRTKKIIYADTRCRTCAICDKYKNTTSNDDEDSVTTPPHVCCKNWNGPATAMEADIIRQGFLQLKEKGLVITEYTGDGDSTVLTNVQNLFPGMTVKKVECKNHLYKNLTKKLMAIASNKVTGKNALPISIQERRELNQHLHRVPIAIKMSVQHYIAESDPKSWMHLQQDIMNIPYHIFGRHKNCKSYFCNPLDPAKVEQRDRVSEMMSCNFWTPLESAITKIANESRSLLANQTSNASESFMSVANKYMEGKRKNHGQRGLYRHRILGAVLSYNDCAFWSTNVYNTLFDKQPSTPWRNKQKASLRTRLRTKKPKAARKISFPVHCGVRGDRNYGSNPDKPDLSPEVLLVAINSLKESLQVNEIQQKEIEEATKQQAGSPMWMDERRKRVTASNAKLISRLGRKTDNTGALNKHFGRHVFTKLIPHMQYGKDHEDIAIREYEKVRAFLPGTVKKSGLVVSLENGIFAASPDGFISDDGILEVKCPPSIKDIDPKKWPSIDKKKSWIQCRNGQLKLKRSHDYYYQVIMQIYVTGRSWCDFFVWTPKGHYIERIFRTAETDKLWREMCENMEYFWHNDLAPEIVDSRLERGSKMYRFPEPRREAIQKKLEKKMSSIPNLPTKRKASHSIDSSEEIENDTV